MSVSLLRGGNDDSSDSPPIVKNFNSGRIPKPLRRGIRKPLPNVMVSLEDSNELVARCAGARQQVTAGVIKRDETRHAHCDIWNRLGLSGSGTKVKLKIAAEVPRSRVGDRVNGPEVVTHANTVISEPALGDFQGHRGCGPPTYANPTADCRATSGFN